MDGNLSPSTPFAERLVTNRMIPQIKKLALKPIRKHQAIL